MLSRSFSRRLSAILALAASGLFGQASSPNVSLVTQVPFPTGSCADLWKDGDLLYVARRSEGFEVLDVSNPASPVSLFSGRSDLFIQDVRASGNRLYCSNESGNGQSILIFDVTNPGSPVQIGSFGGLSMFACNNLALSGNTLYCASLTSNRVVILDVTNPGSVVEMGTITSQSPISLIHDLAVVGDRLYSSWLSGGFEVHNISNPTAPTLVLQGQVPTSLIHNAWPLPNGIHLVTTDEVSGGYLRVWDVSNPSSVVQIAQWRAHPAAVMHNVQIVGYTAFITNYTEGLRIVDLSVPGAPEEAGFYDTFAGVNPFTFGAWGVFADAENIYVADFNTGVYVLDFVPAYASLTATQSVVNWGGTINLTLGFDSAPTMVDLPGQALLTFEVPGVTVTPLPLFNVGGNLPPMFSAFIPYAIGLPAGAFGTYDVTFRLTLLNPEGTLVYDEVSTMVRVQ